jgi:hypothetical protein
MGGLKMTEAAIPIVQCPGCKAKLFDGEIMKGISILKVVRDGCNGLCKRCKTWVPLPFAYEQKQGKLSG